MILRASHFVFGFTVVVEKNHFSPLFLQIDYPDELFVRNYEICFRIWEIMRTYRVKSIFKYSNDRLREDLFESSTNLIVDAVNPNAFLGSLSIPRAFVLYRFSTIKKYYTTLLCDWILLYFPIFSLYDEVETVRVPYIRDVSYPKTLSIIYSPLED